MALNCAFVPIEGDIQCCEGGFLLGVDRWLRLGERLMTEVAQVECMYLLTCVFSG